MSKTLSKNNQDYLIDIIVPVYRDFDGAKKALASMPSAMGNLWEKCNVILVDNGNETFPIDYPKIFKLKENKGFPGGVNYGASKGKAPFILVWSSDVVLNPDSGQYLIESILADKTIGIIAPKLIYPLNSSDKFRPAGKLQHAGLEMTITTDIVHVFLGWNPNHPKINERRECFAVTGAVFATPRSVWNRNGGLFEEYGKGTWEDVDYCMGVKYQGLKVIYEPNASGTHFVGASKERFTLEQNKHLFQMRWGNSFAWTEWTVL